MRLVARDGPNGAGSGANFFNGTTLNIVSRSRYGTRAVSNMTREIRPARTLRVAISKSLWSPFDVMTGSLFIVDPNVKSGYDQTIATAQQEIELLDEQRKELQNRLNTVKQEDRVFETKLVSRASYMILNWV